MATVTEPEPETETAAETGPVTFAPFLINVELYERMIEAGILGPRDPVFLWRGRLVETMPRGLPHDFARMSLAAILGGIAHDGWHVRQESPVLIGNTSMPEPDISLVRGALRDYLEKRPTALDVAILVEVSDSSLANDSREKLEAYAADGIASYWIVNIPARRIDVYTDPTRLAVGKATYRTRHSYGPDDDVPVVFDGHEVGRFAVRDVLPHPIGDVR